MLRISRMECEDGSVRLKLEGRLVGAWVGLLEQTCQIHRRERGTPLILDLADVGFADQEGWKLLTCLEKQGVRCAAWSPYLKALWLSGREARACQTVDKMGHNVVGVDRQSS